MIVKSTGFITSQIVRSQNALNFAYIVYLKLRAQQMQDELIEKYVRRWFVMSILRGRYSGSAESQMDFDVREIAARDFGHTLAAIESAELSDAFWEVGLVQELETSGTSSPFFWLWVAAQVKANDHGFLSKEISVRELVGVMGDIHHIFPRDLLKKAGLSRSQYNQIANYTFTQEEINIKVGNRAPKVYMADVSAQCEGGPLKYGLIDNRTSLKRNLTANCIPDLVFEAGVDQFDLFLAARRRLMAQKIRGYYEAL